jgi:hypothetical protein
MVGEPDAAYRDGDVAHVGSGIRQRARTRSGQMGEIMTTSGDYPIVAPPLGSNRRWRAYPGLSLLVDFGALIGLGG